MQWQLWRGRKEEGEKDRELLTVSCKCPVGTQVMCKVWTSSVPDLRRGLGVCVKKTVPRMEMLLQLWPGAWFKWVFLGNMRWKASVLGLDVCCWEWDVQLLSIPACSHRGGNHLVRKHHHQQRKVHLVHPLSAPRSGFLAKASDHKSVGNMTLKDCLSLINVRNGEPTHHHPHTLKLERYETHAEFCSTPNFYSHSHLWKWYILKCTKPRHWTSSEFWASLDIETNTSFAALPHLWLPVFVCCPASDFRSGFPVCSNSSHLPRGHQGFFSHLGVRCESQPIALVFITL